MQFLITADKLAGTNLFVSVFSYSDKVIYLDIKKLLAPNMRKEFWSTVSKHSYACQRVKLD